MASDLSVVNAARVSFARHKQEMEPDDEGLIGFLLRNRHGKPGAYSFEPVEPELAEQARAEMEKTNEAAYATYNSLINAGIARELARTVLPVAAYTEFYWTVNARALMNFLSLRNAEAAQLEIRRYAEVIENLFAEQMPLTHAAFVAAGRTPP